MESIDFEKALSERRVRITTVNFVELNNGRGVMISALPSDVKVIGMHVEPGRCAAVLELLSPRFEPCADGRPPMMMDASKLVSLTEVSEADPS